MRILLLAMPDSVDMIDYFCKIPNLALVSLAGSLEGHEVKVMDLISFKPKIRKPLKEVLDDFRPQFVGMSAMTFQFGSLLRIASFIRSLYPDIRLAAGGYHASLLSGELTSGTRDLPLDFLIRGEGEQTLKELIDGLEGGSPDLGGIAGLSFRENGTWIHNQDRSLADLSLLPLPRRQTRVRQDFHLLDMPIDVAETSRGCLFDCKFCSITRMYGHTFRRFPVERIIEDLKAVRLSGAKAVFFTDDNITYDAQHFMNVCHAIVEHGLNDLFYIVQVSAVGIAQHPELAAGMGRANFRIAFVGFESMDPSALKEMKKPTSPGINRKACSTLRENGIAVIAGTIVGYPDDTDESIRRNFMLLRQLKPDGIYAQYLTPYPKTVLRDELLELGLITNPDDYSSYNGFVCNVRTKYLSQRELYRILRVELIKSYFNFSLISGNFFLKRYGWYYLKAMARSLNTRILNVIRGKERSAPLDV